VFCVQFKALDAASTQACASAAKSQLLNEVVKCDAACLLTPWSFQRLQWAVGSGSGLFGWNQRYPLVQPTVDPYQPPCNNQTLFDGAPPPCPPPGGMVGGAWGRGMGMGMGAWAWAGHGRGIS